MFRGLLTAVKFPANRQSRIVAANVGYIHTTVIKAAGHSKWQNIRHIKALNDGRKSLLFIKLARQMRLAIQAGGVNPATNSALRAAIDEATKKNMPNSTIQSILKKEQSAGPLKKYILEIRALDQVCIMCVLYTDRFTQLKMEIATILRKNFSLFYDVKQMFDEQGYVEAIAHNDVPLEDLESIATEHAIDAGAEEVEIMNEESKLIRFLCDPIEVDKVKSKLEKIGYAIEHSEHAFVPKSTIKLNPEATQAYEQLKVKLKAVDGVEDIYDNVEYNY